MKIIFNNFTGRKGVDFSTHNYEGSVSLEKASGKFDFAIPRSSFGQVVDSKYKEIDGEIVKYNFDEAIYHYLDYYSHTSVGINSTQWGIRQGQIINANNPRKLPVFIDIENSSNQATVIKKWGTVVTILDNILYQVDQYNGMTNGIYASLGLLNSFYGYHKHRPLWVAWYSDKTIEQVLEAVTKTGFTNPYIWQALSNGDMDGTGKGNGLDVGTSYKTLDLNYWLRSEEDYLSFFRKQIISTELSDSEKLQKLWVAHPELH